MGKIAVIGCGISGMTLAKRLRDAGHEVEIFEKESAPGGIARGFKAEGWSDSVEFFYHHWFQKDNDLLGLIDELGLSGVSLVAELSEDGEVRNYEFDPKKVFGSYAPLDAIKGGDPAQNAQIVMRVLRGEERGAYRDVAALNASAAIVAGGLAGTLEEGLSLAYGSIDSGRALAKLRSLVEEGGAK